MKTFLPLKPSDLFLRNWNPISGLSIPVVVAAEEAAERGDFVELQWTYQKVEKKYAVLRGAKRRLLAGITKLDWDIKVRADLPPEKQKRAEEQASFLRAKYEKIQNLKEALKFLALAELRGFSHLERHYEPDGTGGWDVVKLEPVPQWHWCRDGLYGPWCYTAEATPGGTGVEVDISRGFIVREIEDPVNQVALKCFVFRNYAQKDWANFVEKFGVPFVYWILSEQIAQTLVDEPQKRAEWQALLDQVTGDGTGMFPGGQLETLQAGSNAGNAPFKDFIADVDAETVLAAMSGKLTMLNEATGLGSGNADAHSESWDDICQAHAAEVSETMQEQFDTPLIRSRFPGEEVMAYFELAAQDTEDVAQLVDHAVALNGTPYALDGRDFAERTGYQLSDSPRNEDGDEGAVIRNRANRQERFEDAAGDGIAQAAAQDMAGVRSIITDLLESSDEQMVTLAAGALDLLDQEGANLIQEGGALGPEMERVLISAVANGVFDAPKPPKEKSAQNDA